MSKIVKVRARQTLFDICIQEFGTLENISDIINDNSLLYSRLLKEGDEVIINADGKGVKYIKDYFVGIVPHNNWIPKDKLTIDSTQYTIDSTLITIDKTNL